MVSANEFNIQIFQAIITALCGYLVNSLGIAQNAKALGKLIAVFGSIGFIGSAYSFYRAGKEYKLRI